jgi:HEPN domain-containing protein
MKEETKIWLNYARENLDSSEILLESKLYNPSLQNAQQTVEKTFKALLVEKEVHVKRTHDIFELNLILIKSNIIISISEEECDLLNSIYIPSKYPLGSVLPDFEPDEIICKKVFEIASRVFSEAKKILEQKS